MAQQKLVFTVETPPNVPSRVISTAREELSQIEGVEATIEESPLETLDPASLILAVSMAIPIVEQALQMTKRIHDMANILFDLTHPATQNTRKVVITKQDGTRYELSNLTSEEIEKLLTDK